MDLLLKKVIIINNVSKIVNFLYKNPSFKTFNNYYFRAILSEKYLYITIIDTVYYI